MLENINLEYSGDMSERYMVFTPEDEEGDFRERMLCENEIPGFLSARLFTDDNGRKIGYDISGSISLAERLSENPADAALLCTMLSEMEKIFVRGRNYMFEEDDYVIHPDTIFFSPEGSLLLCYLPGHCRSFRSQLCSLLEYLMNMIDVREQESVVAYYTTYVAAKDENCTFKSLLQGIERARQDYAGENTVKNPEMKEITAAEEGKAGAAAIIKKKGRGAVRVLFPLVFASIFAFVLLFFLLF